MRIIRSAPGKVILFGEHSVVYGYPAIAVPVSGLRTTVSITPEQGNQGLLIIASDIKQEFYLKDKQPTHPIALAVYLVLDEMHQQEPHVKMTIQSQIPIAAGLGSGAALTVSIIRALSAFIGEELDNHTTSKLTYEVEKIYHGSPSGIDNTVISFERPTFFVKGHPPDFCRIGRPFMLLIASSGIPSSTRSAIHIVRSHIDADPAFYEDIFQQIGNLTQTAKLILAEGDVVTLGKLLSENHHLLAKIGVSTPQLDSLVTSAMNAGALGAKLTGSGLGGNMIALVNKVSIDSVKKALISAGSPQVWQTMVSSKNLLAQ
jgi:mevalonate kinase